MAEKKIVLDVVIETADAANSLKDIKNSLKELNDIQKQFGEGSEEYTKAGKKAGELNKKLKDIGDAGKNAEKGLSGIGAGFNKIGLAIKASGIGLAIAAFASIKKILEEQQPVLDAVDTAFTAIGLVIKEVTTILGDVFESTSKANGGFDATKKVINGLITIALAPFKLLIDGIKASITSVQLLWEQSFFGSGDKQRIEELKKELLEINESFIKTGKNVVQAGVDIATNIGEATSEVVDFTKKAADEISKVDIAAAIAQAKRTTDLKNRAEIAQEINKGLIEEYDRLAEKQRQIRDDENLSIEKRIAANEELGKIIEEEQEKLLENANIAVQSAQLAKDANNTKETTIKLLQAENEKKAVLAKIEGLRSEQIVNRIALEKEQIAINQTIINGEVERGKIQRDFDAEQIDNETKRLEFQRANLEIEKEIELQRLEDKKSLYKEGTQARVDADNEYLLKKQEFDNKIVETEKELKRKISEDVLNARLTAAELEVANNEQDFDAKIEVLNAQKDIQLANVNLTSEERLLIEKNTANEIAKIERQVTDLKVQGVKNGLTTIANLAELFAGKSKKSQEKAFKVQQAAAIGSAIIDTYQSATAAYKSLSGIPIVGPVLGGIAAAAAVTAGLLNVKKIKEQKFDSGSGGGGGGGSSTPPSLSGGNLPTPSEPTPNQPTPSPQLLGFGDTGQNNLGTPTSTVRAVVLESDITNAQIRVKNYQTESELGG
jgi:hypothetical protein